MRNLRQRLERPAGKYVALGVVLFLVCVLFSAHAQSRGRRGRGFGGGYGYGSQQRAREQEIMEKALDPAFTEDVFTFARLKFDSEYGGYGRGRAWDDDSPEADLNLIYRMFEATSLKIRPGLNYIDITTKDLADYPFVYMAGASRVSLSDEQAADLRTYLLNGGFLMVDDFWGDEEWEHFAGQAKMIFPNRTPEQLELTNQIFQMVYRFKKQPQIPSVGDFRATGQSYDYYHEYRQMNHDPHYFGIYDDKRRLMMLICHNNHYGDGWEHEGDGVDYFDIFSMPMGYPMFINIVAYAMSH
ncbi:MAG TPA: DUF4159 domain-containing protein [Verrucomicrobiae bacterium]|jgi:hypothetical protein|nr:DUF4159 domain-containing protein [Verrucomicrobiae bacterium]